MVPRRRGAPERRAIALASLSVITTWQYGIATLSASMSRTMFCDHFLAGFRKSSSFISAATLIVGMRSAKSTA